MVQRRDDAGVRRRDLDGGFRGLHLDDGLVELHLVAGLDEPLEDLALGETFTEVWQLEVTKRWHAGPSTRESGRRRQEGGRDRGDSPPRPGGWGRASKSRRPAAPEP